jgi:hypothetical protein
LDRPCPARVERIIVKSVKRTRKERAIETGEAGKEKVVEGAGVEAKDVGGSSV